MGGAQVEIGSEVTCHSDCGRSGCAEEETRCPYRRWKEAYFGSDEEALGRKEEGGRES